MYKLIRTIWNEKTGKSFVKEMKMIDRIKKLENWGVYLHFACGWATNKDKERLDKHCAIIWTMTKEEIKQQEEEKENRKKRFEEAYIRALDSLYAGGW